MEDWVEGSVLASKTLDTGDLKVIAEHIERRAGNMVVDPVNRTSIARTRVGLQVVNPYTAGWPRRDSPFFSADGEAGPAKRGRYILIVVPSPTSL